MKSPKKTEPGKSSASPRKPWRKKTPVEVLLEQGEKLREEITRDETALEEKRKQLEKFEEARKLFEED